MDITAIIVKLASKQCLIWALMKQLSIAQCSGNPTYWNISYDKEEHLADHKSFISSLNIMFNKEHEDFSPLFWIPKLHKYPYRERNTTCAYSFSRNYFKIILTAVKDGIQSYWSNVYSRSSFNQMWILKYWIFWIILIIVLFQKFSLSKHGTFLHFTDHSSWECINTFKDVIKNAVKKLYKLIVIGHELTYFILPSTKKDKMRYTENWATTKLEFHIDDIYVEFGGHICQQRALEKNITYDIYFHIRNILFYK